MRVAHRIVILFVLFFGLLGVSVLKLHAKSADKDQRAILNEGYSILYSNISSMSKSKWVLLFKVESDSLEQAVNEVADYAGTLKNTLERIAKDYPAINIKLQPLPVMEKRTRDAAVKNRLMTFVPIVGLTGMDFERRMLQTLEGPLNHLQLLCDVMADEEPEPSLKKVLKDAHTNLDRLRKRVANLLDRAYYRDERVR